MIKLLGLLCTSH